MSEPGDQTACDPNIEVTCMSCERIEQRAGSHDLSDDALAAIFFPGWRVRGVHDGPTTCPDCLENERRKI